MLDFLYEVTGSAWDSYNPRTQDVNKDLNTGNVIERLAICEEFSLRDLYAKILDQVSNNRKALFEISSCPELVKHPALMQALLQQQASALGDDPQPKKKTEEGLRPATLRGRRCARRQRGRSVGGRRSLRCARACAWATPLG